MKNHTQNVVEELFPDTFLKSKNWEYLWINNLNVFIVCQVWGYRNILKLSCRLFTLTSYKAFKKSKKWSGTSLPASFSRLSLIRKTLGNVYCNSLLNRLWRDKFWIWLYLSHQAVFSAWPKSQDKNVNILRTKRAFKVK